MKKGYLFIITMIAFSTTFAQQKIAVTNEIVSSKDYQNLSPIANPSPLSSATVIWQNDFSDVADWSFANTSIPPLDWRIETNSDLNAIQVTSLPPALTPFASTTVANGFLLPSRLNQCFFLVLAELQTKPQRRSISPFCNAVS